MLSRETRAQVRPCYQVNDQRSQSYRTSPSPIGADHGTAPGRWSAPSRTGTTTSECRSAKINNRLGTVVLEINMIDTVEIHLCHYQPSQSENHNWKKCGLEISNCVLCVSHKAYRKKTRAMIILLSFSVYHSYHACSGTALHDCYRRPHYTAVLDNFNIRRYTIT